MKIQIDFDNLIIRLEGNVNLKEFYDRIKLLLPDGEWKKYTLETNTVIYNWNNPVYIPYDPYPINLQPWYTTIWCGDTNTITPDNINRCYSSNNTSITGIRNFEIHG